jgi:hypothetical protein
MLYIPDERDTVMIESDLPLPLSGAPLPTTIATEHRLLLAYYTALWEPEPPSSKRQKIPTLVSDATLGTIAIADFRRPIAHFSVSISNETFDTHPFAFRGLIGDAIFRVENSSWIRQLAAAQYAHKQYRGTAASKKHFIFAFHDSIFEAAAEDLDIRTIQGSMADAVGEMAVMARTTAS